MTKQFAVGPVVNKLLCNSAILFDIYFHYNNSTVIMFKCIIISCKSNTILNILYIILLHLLIYCAQWRAQRCNWCCFTVSHQSAITHASLLRQGVGLDVSTRFRSINEIPGRDAVTILLWYLCTLHYCNVFEWCSLFTLCIAIYIEYCLYCIFCI